MKTTLRISVARWIVLSVIATALLCVPNLAFSQETLAPVLSKGVSAQEKGVADRSPSLPDPVKPDAASGGLESPLNSNSVSKPYLQNAVGAPASSTAHLLNISTRMQVLADENVLIGGFIITGTQPKTIVVRGLGPSLPVPGTLSDPVIEVHGPSGELLGSNDDWMDSATSQHVIDSGLAPTHELESALWAVVDPGAYTIIVRGYNNVTGVGLFEVYDLDETVDSTLGNVSTRGFVDTGDNVMIGGVIIGPSGAAGSQLLVRAVGPTLAGFGIQSTLADPTLSLFDGNGTAVGSNDNWQDTQEPAIEDTGLEPATNLEPAFVVTLGPGAYTAIVRGKNNGTGVSLVEVYKMAPQILETATQPISSSEGGTITLPSGNSVSMPPGMFSANNNVTLALRVLGPSTGAQYADTTGADAGPSAGQIISVNLGAAPPGAEMSVSLKVPAGFPTSGFTPRLFVKFMWDDGDETLDSFEPIDSVYNPNTRIVTGTVPVTAFTSLRNADGTVECLVLLGSIATSALNRAPAAPTTDSCPLALFAPIRGLSRDQLHVTSPFGFRIHPITGLPEGHKGTDITAGNETNVVAAATGKIVRIGFDQTVKNGHIGGYGQYVLVKHPDGSETRYGHLEAGSVDLANVQGLDYPKRPGRGPLYLVHPIPLTGGTSRIGTMDTTGGATARHLHFEYSTGSITGTGLRDPFPCITLPPPNEDPWNGSWVGRYNASHGGACNWTDDGNVTIVLTADGTNVSGSMTVDGLEVRNLSTCEIVGYDSASGDANGSKTDTTASINYTVTDKGIDQRSISGSMSLMRNGNSISGTITILGGTGPITLSKQ